MSKKPTFVMCVCRRACPGFERLNVSSLLNYVRNELDVEYAIAHPQLCVDDGDRFWEDLAKPGVTCVVGGCDPRMQRKMYKDALATVGADFDKQVIPLDLRYMETPEVMQKVTEALEKLEAEQD